MTKKNDLEPEQVPVYHKDMYPLLKCDNEECGITFILMYYIRPEPYNNKTPLGVHQAFFSFCPFCGKEQKIQNAMEAKRLRDATPIE